MMIQQASYFFKQNYFSFGRLERKSEARDLFTGLSGVCMCVCASGLFMYGRRDGAAGHVPDTQARPYLLSNDLFPKQPLVFPSSTRPALFLLFSIFKYYWRVKFDFLEGQG